MYRAIDTGLQSIDIRSLTEAAQSLGAGWPRIIVGVILPNVRVALLSGAFLTLAIVVGEFTIATFLARPAFGPYLSLLGQTKAYEPAAASIISFALDLDGDDPHRVHRPGRADPRRHRRRPLRRTKPTMSFLTLTGVQKHVPRAAPSPSRTSTWTPSAASSCRSSGRRAAARRRRCG